MEFGNGMNLNNYMMLGNNPSPQGAPSAYQPGGLLYGGIPSPFATNDIAASVTQALQAPSLSGNLNSMPMNRGVARNSPARAYLAAMSSANTRGNNANLRAMMPLQANYANLGADLNSRISGGMFNQSMSRPGISMMMQLLSPFLNQLTSEA